MEIDITLHKRKYRSRKTSVTAKPNPGSANNGRIAGLPAKHKKTRKTIKPRRRAYGPF